MIRIVKRILVLTFFFAMAVSAAVGISGVHENTHKNDTGERPVLWESPCAKVEYAGEPDGYKEDWQKAFAMFFDSLDLVEKSGKPPEEWIYRVTFNWNRYCLGMEEIVVRVGGDFIAYNDKKYVFPPEVDFDQVLETIDALYERIDD
ncbi:MAG: hypothetical protein ACOX81_08740 [Candidatus Heteroscillospira sp.]